MGLKVCCLGSGSSGNCIYVASASTVILIDQGLPVKRVDGCLKALSAPAVPSVIVTHSHADHICQIPAFVRKHGAAVYCATPDAYLELARRGVPANRLIRTEGDFIVGDITVSPFAVSHDVPCVGYGLYSGGCKVSVAAERVLDGMADSDLVVLECNHDEELVLGNAKYTAALKEEHKATAYTEASGAANDTLEAIQDLYRRTASGETSAEQAKTELSILDHMVDGYNRANPLEMFSL